MCAIVGILNFAETTPPSEAALRRMLAMVRHRGPDQFGIYLGDQVGLGNARLSIIDLSGGQQPIANEDETLWIVFNGEIFNYIELKSELESKGHRFSTNTDTEVILHLYEELGPESLRRLNGQFAIAIWNERDRSLFLARDRVGVRPLFYTQAGGSLIFGSEIKSILADPRVRASIDPLALDQIFTYWSTLSPRTCFRGIVDVPPGHYLLAKDGRLTVKSYWALDWTNANPPLPSPGARGSRLEETAEKYLGEFHELLTDATRIRLRADVPVGAYLSGGLDSSVIAAIVRKLGVSRLDTFSIAFSDPKFDESEHQRSMARFLGTDHQVVHATHADIGRAFYDVVWHTECPVMRTAPAPMFLLSQLVRERRFKVVLTGEGADEFLAGYDIFKEAKIRRFWARNPDSKWRSLLLKRLYPDITNLSGAGSSYLAAFFGAGMTETAAPDYSHAVRWRNNRRTCRFFSKGFTAAVAAARGEGETELRYPANFASWKPLEKAQFLEASIFLSQYLLSSQGDRVAMAHSVEGRYPFLDVRVMEFCNRLPSRLKLRVLTEKYLLRQLARQYLPPEILQRRKRPYRAPIHRSFFNEAAPEYVRELLSEEAVKATGVFNPVAVGQLAARLEQGKAVGETDDMALVGILSTQLVHHHFVTAFRADRTLTERDDVKVVLRRTADQLRTCA
ncbi:MAG TPA: asparagine synthase (glutamine-hydrolyzing) [Candidatus Acidoferrum sp.]|nr:asparagine synthase (glutamine-hydrolyzing) [Candidatus Acidoferrum sp.]